MNIYILHNVWNTLLPKFKYSLTCIYIVYIYIFSLHVRQVRNLVSSNSKNRVLLTINICTATTSEYLVSCIS